MKRIARTLLLDADIVAYKFSAAHEKAWDFGGGEPCRVSDLAGSIDSAREYVAELKEQLGASEVIVCLSDPSNRYFRHDIYPSYKGTRKGIRKPEHLMTVKGWLSEHYQTYQRPGLEADDCMGILATHPTLIKGDKIMVSEDKDMKTIPGFLFNPRTDTKPRKITRREACRAHFIQTIVGDTCDGYPGAPGVGPKSAFVKQIEAAREPSAEWPTVLEAFTESLRRDKIAGCPLEAALTQARLARILRASDWDFKKKCPILWSPL